MERMLDGLGSPYFSEALWIVGESRDVDIALLYEKRREAKKATPRLPLGIELGASAAYYYHIYFGLHTALSLQRCICSLLLYYTPTSPGSCKYSALSLRAPVSHSRFVAHLEILPRPDLAVAHARCQDVAWWGVCSGAAESHRFEKCLRVNSFPLPFAGGTSIAHLRVLCLSNTT